ncbi:hypothetical protein [Endothiovibrio diazotrophicus]
MCIAFPHGGARPPAAPPSRFDRWLSRLPEGVQMAIGAVVLFGALLGGLFRRR